MAHHTCLAHLARDVAYADETSEDVLPLRLRLWQRQAFTLADGIDDCGQAPGLVDPTNNAGERALRMAVSHGKVTNGYRAMWTANCRPT